MPKPSGAESLEVLHQRERCDAERRGKMTVGYALALRLSAMCALVDIIRDSKTPPGMAKKALHALVIAKPSEDELTTLADSRATP
jgi:hypothetical protein